MPATAFVLGFGVALRRPVVFVGGHFSAARGKAKTIPARCKPILVRGLAPPCRSGQVRGSRTWEPGGQGKKKKKRSEMIVKRPLWRNPWPDLYYPSSGPYLSLQPVGEHMLPPSPTCTYLSLPSIRTCTEAGSPFFGSGLILDQCTITPGNHQKGTCHLPLLAGHCATHRQNTLRQGPSCPPIS